jgi:hypothetical protein
MVTTEERMRILKMIQDGKITAEEGAHLIEALESGAPKAAPRSPEPPMPPAGRSRWFRVRVTDTDSGKTRVNVRLPVSLVGAGLKLGAKFSPEVEGLDVETLTQIINSGELGQIVDVYNDDDGEHVEVFIE